MSDLKQLDETYVGGPPTPGSPCPDAGEGSLVYDEDGKRYIDMGSGIGVTAFGIADQQWQQAVTAQLGVLQHTSNLYYTQPCVLLAQQLCKKTGMKKVFFSNSGAEANECAIKTARKYACDKKGPEYYTIVTLEKQLPWPDHHHPGRHRPGPLSRTVPASVPGLRPYPRQRHCRLGADSLPAQSGGASSGVHPGAKEAWYP